MTALQDWLARNVVTHSHCPHECEKPQPRVLDDGRCVCGRCLIKEGLISEMIPCTPEVCD